MYIKTDGDYDDHAAAVSSVIPEKDKLPGITEEEYGRLISGYTRPTLFKKTMKELCAELTDPPVKVEKYMTDLKNIRDRVETLRKEIIVLETHALRYRG